MPLGDTRDTRDTCQKFKSMKPAKLPIHEDVWFLAIEVCENCENWHIANNNG